MSQKEQEAALDERIERIRKKNEEIERRRKEVEADRQNAEKLNATVKFTPSETKNSERQPISRPPVSNRNPRFEKRIPDTPYSPKPPTHVKKVTNVSDKDGPPPDPVYTFLSDHTRDQPRGDYSPNVGKASRENESGDEFRGQHGRGRGRGWNRGRGSPMRGGRRGGNSGNQFSRQGPQQPPEYQAWRAEREKIDQDRITRQKTAEGNWRREWDSEKLSQDENQEYQSRPSFSKKKKRDSEELKIHRTVTNDLAIASTACKENEIRTSDKPVKTVYYAKGVPEDKKTVAFDFDEGASCNDINDDDLEENFGFEHRLISSCGDSIKISVSNKPIKSVKVNPVNAAGTGRVGPRQKPRLSYSSQSEDEKEIRAHAYHKRPPPMSSPHEALPQRDNASSRKPPLPPGRGPGHEFSSPKKKLSAVKSQSPVNKRGDESPVAEKKELSRESSHENISEGGDDSWEDVATTSGNESADYSDADVAKKSDSSDNSIPRGQVSNDDYKKDTPDIKEDSLVKSNDFNGKREVRNEEFCEPTDGVHDEMDEETERLKNEDSFKTTGEGLHDGVHEACEEKFDDSSLETAEGLCPSVDKEESSIEKDKAPVTELEDGNNDGPAVENEAAEDEERATRKTSEGELEPTTGVPDFHEDISGPKVTGDLMANSKEAGQGKEGDLVNDLTVEGSIGQSPSCATSDPAESQPEESKFLDSEDLASHQKTGGEATAVGSIEEETSPLQQHGVGPDSSSPSNGACK